MAQTASETERVGTRLQREAWAPAAPKRAKKPSWRAHLKALQASQVHHVIAAFWNSTLTPLLSVGKKSSSHSQGAALGWGSGMNSILED